MLTNGEYAWQAVATAYQAESGETDPWDTTDLKKHWHKVLCNGGKKPTRKPGAVTNPKRQFYQRYDEHNDDEPDVNDGSLHGASGEEGKEGGTS